MCAKSIIVLYTRGRPLKGYPNGVWLREIPLNGVWLREIPLNGVWLREIPLYSY